MATDTLTTSVGLTVAGDGPNWPSYNVVQTTFGVNVNGYPITSRFGNNAVGIAEALVGMINIPATSTAGNHAAGVAGYALTGGSGQGAVGTFGFAGATGANASVWGLNCLVANTAKPQDVNGAGFDGVTAYGLEIDINLKKVGTAAPNYALRGIYIVGDSESAPAGGVTAVVNAVEVDSFGINKSPKLQWNNAFVTNDGAATNALSIGATSGANNVGSQRLLFRGRNAGGTGKQAFIQMDQDGNLTINADAGSVVALAHNGTTILQALPSGIVRVPGEYQVGTSKVVGARKLGWSTPGGTATRTAFNTGSVTLVELAERVKALIDDLHASSGHGLIGS